jgi:hypothetical protein
MAYDERDDNGANDKLLNIFFVTKYFFCEYCRISINMEEQVECDVRGKLEAILSEQVSRLLISGSSTKEGIEMAMKKLRNERLLPEQIESDICKEIKIICTMRHDEAMPNSSRLDGFGWSQNHLKEHMKRMLKSKLEATASILRTTKSTNTAVVADGM